MCGDPYGERDRCEFCILAEGQTRHGFEDLELGMIYCTAHDRCRAIGSICGWKDETPSWCPKKRGEV